MIFHATCQLELCIRLKVSQTKEGEPLVALSLIKLFTVGGFYFAGGRLAKYNRNVTFHCGRVEPFWATVQRLLRMHKRKNLGGEGHANSKNPLPPT